MKDDKKCYKSITAIDQDTLATCTIVCEVPDRDFNLKQAVKETTKEFLESEEGKEFYKGLDQGFCLGEFEQYIPEELCKSHGFKLIDVIPEEDIDWDIELLKLD